MENLWLRKSETLVQQQPTTEYHFKYAYTQFNRKKIWRANAEEMRSYRKKLTLQEVGVAIFKGSLICAQVEN